MEKESTAEYQILEARPSLGFVGQATKIQGAKVKIGYNPENPEESVVVE